MKRGELFERLDPPSGGLAGLRARLDDRPSVTRRATPFLLAAALAAAVVFVVTRPRPVDPVASARAHSNPAEVGLGLAHAPPVALAIDESMTSTTALTEVRSGNPDVKIYWVSSTTWHD